MACPRYWNLKAPGLHASLGHTAKVIEYAEIKTLNGIRSIHMAEYLEDAEVSARMLWPRTSSLETNSWNNTLSLSSSSRISMRTGRFRTAYARRIWNMHAFRSTFQAACSHMLINTWRRWARVTLTSLNRGCLRICLRYVSEAGAGRCLQNYIYMLLIND